MTVMKLTKRLIDGTTYQGQNNARHVLWDDEVSGFGVRFFPTGRKSYVLSYRFAGRKRLLTICAYGVLTLDEARVRARAELAKVETQDIDPVAERERARQGETIADLCAAYLERHAKPRKKTWPEDERVIKRTILPKWGTLKATALQRADVAMLHHTIGVKEGHPVSANRVRELIAKIFECARRWGFVPETHPNPARGLDDFRETKRDRWIKPAELPHIAKAINDEADPINRAALWLYLLTGVRKSELLTARWEHIDWDRQELFLPDTKAGRSHYVPLSGPAQAILRDMPRDPNNPYLLPGPGSSKLSPTERDRNPTHLATFTKPWERVRYQATLAMWREDPRAAALIERLTEERRARLHRNTPACYVALPTLAEIRAAADFPLPPGVDDVRLHDLRRTVGSWLAQAGNSLHLIGKVLNHSNPATTQVYARFAEDTVRTALEAHATRLLGVAGLLPPAELVPLVQGQPEAAAPPAAAATANGDPDLQFAGGARVIDLAAFRKARA